MILKNAYLSICLLWNHAIATKFIQTQALGFKSAALAAPVCFMLSISLTLAMPQLCWKPVPCQETQSQPHHEPIHDSLHTFPVRKKILPWTGLWQLRNSCPGTVNSSRERAGSWSHRHVKIATTKTPEFKSTSSWWFQQKSPARQSPAHGKCPTLQKDDGVPMTDETVVSSSKLAR